MDVIIYLIISSIIMVSGGTGFVLNDDNDNEIVHVGTTESCDKEYSCLDCSTAQVCIKDYYGNITTIRQVKCPSDQPFCDYKSGACSITTQNYTCGTPTSEFICHGNGHYPNPNNCNKYYVCVDGTAYGFDCGSSYYNSKSQNCKYTYYCHEISCTEKSGIKVAYGPDSSYYGYCSDSQLLTFEKCPGSFKLDENKQYCVPVCEEEGYQGDPYDCSKYYKCSYVTSSSTLTITHEECLDNQLFDSVNSECLSKQKNITCASGVVYNGI